MKVTIQINLSKIYANLQQQRGNVRNIQCAEKIAYSRWFNDDLTDELIYIL